MKSIGFKKLELSANVHLEGQTHANNSDQSGGIRLGPNMVANYKS